MGRTQRTTVVAILVVAVLAAAGCGSVTPTTTPVTPATGALPPSTTAPPTTVASSSTTIDVTAVPAHITITYVAAVLAVLNHLYGNALRSAVTAKRLTRAASRDLAAIYEPRLLASEQGAVAQMVQGGAGTLRAHPGDPVTTVVSLPTATASCVFAEVRTNSNRMLRQPAAPLGSEYIELRSAGGATPGSLNTTPWRIARDDTFVTPTRERSRCPAS